MKVVDMMEGQRSFNPDDFKNPDMCLRYDFFPFILFLLFFLLILSFTSTRSENTVIPANKGFLIITAEQFILVIT